MADVYQNHRFKAILSPKVVLVIGKKSIGTNRIIFSQGILAVLLEIRHLFFIADRSISRVPY